MKEKISMSFADFSGKNGPASFESLLETMENKGLREIYVSVGKKYVLHIKERSMSIYMTKSDRELARTVNEHLLGFLQKHGSHAFIGLRFEKYVVQFVNGHLDHDESGKEMPMHVKFNRYDETFIKSLNIVQPGSGELFAHSLRSGRAYENHIVVGPLAQLWAFLRSRGSDEQVAKTLGFEFVSNPSSLGQFEDDDSKCPVERLCIYSQEIAKPNLSSSVLDVYDRMKRLRRLPSCIFRFGEDLEIHVESDQVSFSHFDSYSEEICLNAISCVLGALGIENLDSTSVSYLVDRKSHKTQIVDRIPVQRIERTGKILWSLILCFAVALESVFVAFLAYGELGILKTILAVLPGLVFLLSMIKESGERDWLHRIGSFDNVLFPLPVHMVSILAFLFYDFYALIIFLAIVAIPYIMEKYQIKKIIKRSRSVQYIDYKIELYCQKIFSNKVFKVIWTVLFIGISSLFLFTYGFIAILVAVPILFAVCLISLLSRDFRNDFERDLESYNDKFFAGYARKRPEMTQYCIIRVKKSKCPKLLIWVPLKVLCKTLRGSIERKYPKILLLSSIKCYWRKIGQKIKS